VTIPPASARLFSRLTIAPSGCLLWTGAKTGNGYGHMSIGGRLYQVHRLMYEIFAGPIPNGLELDHLCKVRLCASPAHLEPVTHRVNVLRGDSPAALQILRTHCPYNHEYTAANTYVSRTGKRQCRTCNKAKCRQYRATGSTVAFTGQFAAVTGDSS